MTDRSIGSEWTPESALKHLEEHYTKLGSGVAFSGITAIHNFYDRKLSKKRINDFLKTQNVHTLFKNPRLRAYRDNGYNKYFVRTLREVSIFLLIFGTSILHFLKIVFSYFFTLSKVLEADLVVLTDEMRLANKNHRYLSCWIDCFSRKLIVHPLKTKKGDEMCRVFRKVYKEFTKSNYKIQVLSTDKGSEYMSRQFQDLLKDLDIKHKNPLGLLKVCTRDLFFVLFYFNLCTFST